MPDQMRRLEQLAQHLHRHPNATPEQLAELLHVSTRTVYRYLQMLKTSEADTTHSEYPGSALCLHHDHVASLETMVAHGALLSPNEVYHHRTESLFALRTNADSHTQLDSLASLPYHRDPLGLSADMLRHLTVVRSAIRLRRKVRLHRFDWNDPTPVEVMVSPFYAGCEAGLWTVVGFSEAHGQRIHIPLEAITSVSLLTDRFRMPYRFDGPSTVRRVPVDRSVLPHVLCLCTAEAADILVSTKPSRLISLTEDIDGLFRCTVRCYGAQELTWWVLAWQGALWVTAPHQAREAVRSASAIICNAHQPREEPG